jgi:hypothetical protein
MADGAIGAELWDTCRGEFNDFPEGQPTEAHFGCRDGFNDLFCLIVQKLKK